MFKNLRAKFDSKTEIPIEIDEICAALVEMGYQDDIRVVDEAMDTSELLGTYVQFTQPSGGMYSEPHMVSLIVYPTNVSPELQRIVCAKELVHVCDAKVSKTSSEQDILELAQVLTSSSSISEEPRMTLKVATDIIAQQKGLQLLFPKAARIIARQQVQDGTLTLDVLSQTLQLPTATVEDMLTDDWDNLAEFAASI